ncbi:phosphotransferase family protein [Arthrobacter flavus]|uniref:Phosphotransferase family protein n=1 Tax=Arthrobacter flavus TaxID=95172 RepID=A0ABW4Q534_9MICC
MTTVPESMADRSGRELKVHRAWPKDGGRLIFEASDAENGQIRAGTIEHDGRVRLSPFAEDPLLTGLPGAAAQGQLLVHRYKRRAVVRDAVGFTKLLVPGKAEGVAASHRLMRALAQPSGIVMPDVVSQHSAGVTLTAVHGVSFHELGQAVTGQVSSSHVSPHQGSSQPPLSERVPSVEDGWEQAWHQWAVRWPRLAVAPAVSGVPELPTHSTRDEARTVSRWVNQVQEFGALAVSAERLQGASSQVARLLISGAPERSVLSHRDLHDKQLLFNADSGSVGLIDCDTVSVAEPALDLANLLVHIDFRRAQGVFSAAAASTAKQAILETALAMKVSDTRMHAYSAATRLRLACLYAFRPPYRAVAHFWFERLEADLRK